MSPTEEAIRDERPLLLDLDEDVSRIVPLTYEDLRERWVCLDRDWAVCIGNHDMRIMRSSYVDLLTVLLYDWGPKLPPDAVEMLASTDYVGY